MSTLKVYLADSTILQSDAIVTKIGTTDGRPWVRLDQTIFHPQGGGQKADRGRIGAVEVLHVGHAGDGEVDHFVGTLDNLDVGRRVELFVDAAWREVGARNHSAGHLIAALAEHRCTALRAVAGHHWPGEARVEFEVDGPAPEDLCQTLHDDLAGARSDDLKVAVIGDPYTDRAIRIGAFTPVPCGGIHVQRVSEIGFITIAKIRVKPGKLRVSYSVSNVQ